MAAFPYRVHKDPYRVHKDPCSKISWNLGYYHSHAILDGNIALLNCNTNGSLLTKVCLSFFFLAAMKLSTVLLSAHRLRLQTSKTYFLYFFFKWDMKFFYIIHETCLVLFIRFKSVA